MKGKEGTMSKILLIDDDPDFVAATQAILQSEGFEVDTAGNATEGLQKVEHAKPDLLILDVMMQTEYEGFQVARTIREDLGERSLPIIILSGVRKVKEIPYGFQPDDSYLPVDIFLDKPTDPIALVRTIRDVLSESRETPETPL
jgi:two-component system, OmpR family, alkaline phosphatase synthesis response regulator PhoP